MANRSLSDISEQMRDIDFCMLTTRSEGGKLASRPMSNNREVEYDGDSYFFSCGDTRTVEDIARDPQVGLGFQGKGGLIGGKPFFIAVEGLAELIRDKARFEEHWTKDLDRWFERGIDTAGLTLIRVRAERLHYWDGGEEGEILVDAAAA